MTLVLFPNGVRAELGEPSERKVAVLPGASAAVHRIELPGLTDKQARAAARLIVSEASLSPDALHVAVGRDEDGWRTVVAVERDVMAAALASLTEEGIDPDAVIPATLLLGRPEVGAVRGTLAGETIVRTAASAYVEEPQLAGLFDDRPHDLPAGDVAASVAAAVATPEVDLRQGPFARTRRWSIDWVAARRLAQLAAILLVLTVAIELIAVLRTDAAAKRIEQANAAAEAEARPRPRALPLVGLATSAIAGTPDSELSTLLVDDAGSLRATVRGRSATVLDQVQARMASSGVRITADPTVMTDGRATRQLTVAGQ